MLLDLQIIYRYTICVIYHPTTPTLLLYMIKIIIIYVYTIFENLLPTNYIVTTK